MRAKTVLTITGRIALTLLSAVAVGAAGAATPRAFPAPVYVTLQASSAVESLPGGTTWRNLPAAHYIAISPDGKLLLVSSATTPEAWLLDARTGAKLATIDVGKTPQGVGFSPDGRLAVAVGAGTDSIVLIDVAARKATARVAVGPQPHNVAFSGDGKLAYVTLQGGTGVAIVDLRAAKKVGEIEVPGLKGPHNLVFAPDHRTLWIRDLVDKVAAVDVAGGRELGVITVGPGHAGIDITPDGRSVVTGAIAGTAVDVIDARTFKVTHRIDVGQGPHGVRASADGRWAYAAVTGTATVAVIDLRTFKVVERVSTNGKMPFWVALAGRDQARVAPPRTRNPRQ